MSPEEFGVQCHGDEPRMELAPIAQGQGASLARSISMAASLVRAGSAGDRVSFDLLFDRWFRATYAAACHAQGDGKGAEELTSRLMIQELQFFLPEPRTSREEPAR